MSSVKEEYPKEQARCRELLTQYREIGPNGRFGAILIEATLKEADEAMASGDIVRIVKAFQRMRGHS